MKSKAHGTLRLRLGEVAYIEHMRSIGARGGKAKVKKGGLLSPQNRATFGPTRGRWVKDKRIKREQREEKAMRAK
jgi:hypothetical protein